MAASAECPVRASNANLHDGNVYYFITAVDKNKLAKTQFRVCLACPLRRVCDQGRKGIPTLTYSEKQTSRLTPQEITGQAACLR